MIKLFNLAENALTCFSPLVTQYINQKRISKNHKMSPDVIEIIEKSKKFQKYLKLILKGLFIELI